MKRINVKRKVAAGVVALAVTGAVGASAASLGGVDADQLGADTGIVASCDANGIDVSYQTAYHRPSGLFRVNQVILRSVSEECAGSPYRLTMIDAAGTPVEESGDALDVRNIRDRQPGPGVDRAGVARIRVRFPVENVDGIAIIIGGPASTP